MVFFKREETATPAPQAPATPSEISSIEKAVQAARLPEQAASVAAGELERLRRTDPSLPEYPLIQAYLEFLVSLPWSHSSNDSLDLERAERILEAEHFGLMQVKERLLEFLAVQTLRSHHAFRLLVVDDERIARTNLEYVLTKEGYRVQTAANGLEALALMEKAPYDMVLTDLKMDKMDGNQLLEASKRMNPDTDVVMITGFATVDSAVSALRKGAAHYLPKPIQIDELRKTIREILDRKRHLQMTRSPILCFAGPPGTGKTSIGRAIAAALERRFIRISLAGLRDEAELRGHRRTYVGAMPGRILREIQRAGVNNPVFMLDEIDKIGQEFQGDAASVLLEVLDPEQNAHFMDHYLDLPFDLSGTMFITTANVIERLSGPLRDRLERIDFPGYTETEKLRIAQRFLVPRQLAANSLESGDVVFTDAALRKIIRGHTFEAGLRGLEREIAAICRKAARVRVRDSETPTGLHLDEKAVADLLGPDKFSHEAVEGTPRIGVVTGLVWTELGGESIFVEASSMAGTRQLILTGSLGQVLQESAQTALSFVRSHASEFGIPEDFFADRDIHIHIPSGSVSKDGPSAGLTIAVALISLLSGRPAYPRVAMTGELSLSGRILPIQGLKEKLLAAQRAGIQKVFLPKANEGELKRLDAEITEGLEAFPVTAVDAVVDQALLPKGTPGHSPMS